MPKNRGAEQKDVDGPWTAAWLWDGGVEASSSLPWIGVDDPSDAQRLQAEHAVRLQESANFQLGGPEKLTGANDPRHALRRNGGLADLWYMDDGDIMCHPILVPSYLQEFDVGNASVGVDRNSETYKSSTT